jgi:hypothetical protein
VERACLSMIDTALSAQTSVQGQHTSTATTRRRDFMRAILTVTFAILVLAAASCDHKDAPKEAATQAASTPATSTHAGHAPVGVKPGSHEDWCGGHQVPESMCTRCNASLIPAFKATGDWCEEHGLPESQCLICNPDLKIERPPKTAGK